MARWFPGLPLSEARKNLAEAVNTVAYRGERIVLGRRGRDVAALISVEDLALCERLLEEHDDRPVVVVAREALAESDGRIPYEQARRELGLTESPMYEIAVARAARRGMRGLSCDALRRIDGVLLVLAENPHP